MLQTLSKRLFSASRKVWACILACCLLLTCVLTTAVVVSAETATVTAAYLKDWYDSNSFSKTVVLEAGETYRFTMLYKKVSGADCSFSIQNTQLINGETPQNGTAYDTSIGLLTYTFTAVGGQTVLSLSSAAGWPYCETYIAEPKLEKVSDGSEVDCDPLFATWATNWGTRYKVGEVERALFEGTPCNHVYDNACDATCSLCGSVRAVGDHVYDDEADTDCNECGTVREIVTLITAAYMKDWYDSSSFIKPVAVEAGETYRFTVLYKKVTGGDCGFSIGNIRLISGETPQNGATYDIANGLLTYTFTANGGEVSLSLNAASGWPYCETYIAAPKMEKLDADGNVIGEVDCDPLFTTWTRNWGTQFLVGEVDSNLFNGTKYLALSDLSIDQATLTTEFSQYFVKYEATVPNAVTDITVRYTLGETGKSAVVAGNTNLQEGYNTVTVTVTNNDGSETVYTVTVYREPDLVNKIPAYFMGNYSDGQSITGSVVVQSGTTYTFTVLYKYVSGSKPQFTLSGDAVGGTVCLMEKDVPKNGAVFDGETGKVTYTFKANGTLLNMSAFLTNSSWLEYDELYFAKPTLYVSDAAGNKIGDELDCNADFDPYWSYNLSGNQKVVYVKESSFGNEAVTALSDLQVAGYDLLPLFNRYNTAYSLTVPYNVDSVDVSYTLGEGAKSAVVEGNTELVEGNNSVTVTVTNNDDSVVVYTINIVREIDYSNYILAMHMANYAEGMSTSTMIEVKRGKTYTFTMLWKNVGNKEASFSLGSAVHKTLITGETAWEGVDYDPATGKLSYTFTATGNFLSMSANFTITGWTKYQDIYFAEPTLYESDAEGNKIGAYIDCNADFEPMWDAYLPATRDKIWVEKDFFNGTECNSLSDITLGGQTLNPSFSPYSTDYSVTLPYYVGTLDIGYTLGVDGVSAVIIGNEEFKQNTTSVVTISVTNKDGTITDYTLSVFREKVPEPKILSLDIGHKLRPSFDVSVTQYAVSVPYEVDKLDLSYELPENTVLESIVGNGNFEIGVASDVVITVKNSVGVTKSYIITVTREGLDADAASLQKMLTDALKDFTPDNNTTKEMLSAALVAATANSEYTVSIADFFKLKAVTHVKDNFGTIIEGENGYITAVVNMVVGEMMAQVPLKLTIEAPVKEYTFTEDEVSKPEDFILSANGTILDFYTGSAKKVIIPDGVEEIGYAWNDAWDIEAIEVLVIPDSVKTIAPSMGFGMIHLEVAYVGDGIAELTEGAFQKCMFLQYVRLPKNLKVLDNWAFAQTFALSDLRLPETLETIRKGAFEHTLIHDLVIPAGVKTIEGEAFTGGFTSAEQLVVGSDNVSRWYPFSDPNDPDIVRLQAIADAVVDFHTLDEKYFWDKRTETPLGDPEWKGGDVTATYADLYILGKDTEIKEYGITSNGGWFNPGYNVYIRSDAKSYRLMADEAADMTTVRWRPFKYVIAMDMTLAEIAARAQYAADRLAVSADSSEEELEKAIASSYFTTLGLDVKWTKPLELVDETATAVMQIAFGKTAFEITIQATVSDGGQTDVPPATDDIPIVSLKANLKDIVWDENAKIIEVKDGVTVEALVDALVLADGYYLAVYDEEGLYVPAEYYAVAVIKNGYTVKVLGGSEVMNVFTVKVTGAKAEQPETPENSETGVASVAATMIVLMAFAAMGLFVLRRRSTVR